MVKFWFWTVIIIGVLAYIMITRGPHVIIDPLVTFIDGLELP